jgi:hypothetical protein
MKSDSAVKSNSAVVRLKLFSGLPNPQWRLSPAEAARVMKGLSQLPVIKPTPRALASKAVPVQQPVFPDPIGRPRAGYRGFEITFGDLSPSVPTFTVYRNRVLEVKTARVRQDVGNDQPWEEQIWKTVPDEIRKKQLAEISFAELTAATQEGPIQDLEGPYVRLRCNGAPSYLGGRDSFNAKAHVRQNNCYNYATKVLNTSNPDGAIPGRNNDVNSFTMNRLRTALEADELERVGMQLPSACPPAGTHYVAIVIREFASGRLGDFHCLRMDRRGTWSHKDGDGPVTNVDDTGARMVDLTQTFLVNSPKLAGIYLVHHEQTGLID